MLTPRRHVLIGGLTFLSDFEKGLKVAILRESVLFSLLVVSLLPRFECFFDRLRLSPSCLWATDDESVEDMAIELALLLLAEVECLE